MIIMRIDILKGITPMPYCRISCGSGFHDDRANPEKIVVSMSGGSILVER